PNAGERKERPAHVAIQGKPMPACRLVAVGLAVARRRYEAAALLERWSPELRCQHLVVAYVRHASRRLAWLQQHESPPHRHKFALAVVGPPDDRRRIGRKDR